MSTPLWAIELSEAFWDAAGTRESFPRMLRGPIARGMPMAVVFLPRLRLRDVQGWLARNGVVCPYIAEDRGLRACLAALRGWAYVFLDGTDPEDEQRQSLAHELAHFLRHYWHPRREACRQIGARVIEVLDGCRPPTPEERLHALIARVPIGFHWHFMHRENGGGIADEVVVTAEREADRLAYELLAPADEVYRRAGDDGQYLGREALSELLRGDFGLPATHALCYSRLLLPSVPGESFLRRLGLAH